MANDKKFIVKNGLLTTENVIIGSETDNGVNKLQVTGSSIFTGAASITQASGSTPSLNVINSGGIGNSIITQFTGDSASLQIVNISAGDYGLYNSQQNNGIEFYDTTAGVKILYNDIVDLEFTSTAIDFKRSPTVNGNIIFHAGNDGAGSGLDADLLDGLDSLQFLRSDEDDTFNGNLIITGNLTVSGTTTTINTETILLADNIITLNSNYTGSTPTENAGFEIERGTLVNSSLIWDETNDYFKLISAGTDIGRIITTADEGSGNGFDADTVDGLQAAQFLRSDANDIATGQITFQATITVGNNTAAGATIVMDGQAGNRYIFSNNGEIGFLNSAFAYAAYSDASNNWRVLNDTYAKRFIDADNNTYLLDPAGTSVLNTIDLEGSLRHNSDTTTYITFPAANQFEVRTNGVQRLLVTDTYAESSNDFRAPRFVDSNNNAFYADPAGTSIFAALNVYSGGLTADVNIGRNATERFNINVTDGQGYFRYYQDETDSTDHSVNFEIISTSTGSNRFNFNRDINLATNNLSTSGTVVAGSVYASVYYDLDNELYYADLNNTDVSINVAGEITAGNGLLATPTYSFGSDPNTGIYRFAADTIGFSAGGNDEFRIYTTYTLSPGSSRAPIFYDSNNTAYYGDFASTSVMNRIGIDDYIQHNGNTTTYLGFSGANIFKLFTNNVERLNIDDNSADFSVNVYAPQFVDSNNNAYYGDFASTSIMSSIDIDDYIRHNGNTTAYFGFSANNIFKLFTNNVERLNIDDDSADFSVNVYAPRYYDNNNNAYYGDFASASVMNTIGIDSDLFHNGNVTTKLAFGTNTISLATNGTSRIDINDTYVAATNQMRAPIYYDTAGTTDYLDLGATGANDTLNIRGRINVGGGTDLNRIDDITGNGGITIAPYQGYTATSNPTIQISGGNGGYALTALNKIDIGANPLSANNKFMSFAYDGVEKLSYRGDNSSNFYNILEAGVTWSTMDTGGTFGLSATAAGDIIIGDQSIQYTTMDATPLVGLATDNKLHVNGSIQLNGADDAIVFGVATASFMKNNEIGFGLGSGWYMTDATYLRVRNNNTIYTTGDIQAARFVDSSNVTYYADPASTSVMNRIGIDDYIQHNGDTDNYFGFAANDTFRVFTGNTQRFNVDNDSADFTVNVYAPRYYDSNNNAYYGDFASTSVMNRIDIDDYIRHNGDLDNYFGFAAADTFRVFTGGTQRFNVDNDSADFAVNVYAPRYYDSQNVGFYVDPASTSILAQITMPQNPVGVSFASNANVPTYYIGQQNGDNDGWKIFGESPSGTNTGALIIQSEDDFDANESIRLRFKQAASPYQTTDSLIAYYNYVLATDSFRAPIFYDSQNTSYYTDPASTSIMNTVRVNRLEVDSATTFIDSRAGDYGTIRVEGSTNTWAGYAIADDWVFMSDGPTNAGIYNDTDNEWSIQFTRNAGTDLQFNGVKQGETENGYFLATNQMRAPVYYAPSSTGYYLDLDATNTNIGLKLPAIIDRDGFAAGGGSTNIFLRGQDANQFIWNTATNWGIFWATATDAAYRYAPFGDNMITFVGAGNTRAAIDLDNGNAYFQGEVIAANFNINGGNENLGLLKTYGAGLADTMLFDGTEYWEKRVIQNMQGAENNATTVTAEFVKNGDGPFSSSYVLRTDQYRDFYSDYIPVEPGEEIYGEMAVRYISGSGGLTYMGVEQYDKDKLPIAANNGTTYFVVSAVNVTNTAWTTYRAHHTLPTTHTPYLGSDGAGVKYVRIRYLMNHSTGGALREYGPPILKRSNHLGNVSGINLRAESNVYGARFYDADNESFYLDPASTSILNIVDASNFRDRDNTAYFMNPLTGGKVAGTWDFTNGTISNLNNLTFADPGPNEGIEWLGGSGWKIYESPDNLTTDSGGNLQIVQGTTSRARFNTSGDIIATRYVDATRFRDSNNVAYYVDPASTSIMGGIDVDEYIRHNGDTNTYIRFVGADDMQLVAGGRQMLRMANGTDPDRLRFVTDSDWTNSDGDWNMSRDINVGRIGTAVTSFNAPRFIDSDDVNYYGDFAGTSITNIIRTNQIQIDGATYLIDSATGDYGSIEVSGNKNGYAGYSINGQWNFMSSGAANAGIYNDTNNEWAILAAQNSDVQIFYNGIWEERSRSGYMEARGSYRAPIFYDSNNTAYLIDGNGTSRLLNLNVDNTIGGSVNGYSERLLATNNLTISPSEDPAGNLRFGSTSWTNNNASPYADYLHLRSYTDASGGNDNLVTFRKDAIGMRIWQQTWGSATAYSTFRNVAIYNENPGASNDFYASLYYDSDDTAYYVNPNGVSHIKHLEVAATTLTADYFNAAIEVREYNYGGAQTDNYATAPRIGFHWGGRVASQIALASNGEIRILNNPGTITENFRSRISYADDSHRSPIFYDLDNTVYYTNPASTSIMNILDVRGEIYNDGWFRNDTSGRGILNTATGAEFYSDSNTRWRATTNQNTSAILFATSGNTVRGYVYTDNSNNIGFLDQTGNWSLRTSSAIVDSYRPLHAVSFFDRDNTAYFIDPSNTVVSANLIGDVNVNDGKILIQRGTNTFTSYVDDDSTAGGRAQLLLQSSYSDLVIMSKQTNANGHGSTLTFATQETTSNNYAKWVIGQGQYQTSANILSFAYGTNTTNPHGVLGTLSANADMQIFDGGRVDATGQMRAPIYYDRNDTAYYLDPNSTSDLNQLIVNNIRIDGATSGIYTTNTYLDVRYGSTGAGGMRLYDADNVIQGYWYGSGTGEHGFLDNDGAWAVRVRTGTNPLELRCDNNVEFQVFTTYTLSPGSSRAPIFYDSNDTGYFTDPNSTSRLNTLRTNSLYPVYDNNTTVYIDYPTGDYGSIAVYGTGKSSFSGYSIQGQWNFMSNGVGSAGIYNDTDNKWAVLATQNAGVDLYYNTAVQLQAANGYGLAPNSMRSPLFYDQNDAAYYGDFASTSVMNSLDIRGEIYNDGWFRNDTSGRGLYNTATATHFYSTGNGTYAIAGNNTGASTNLRLFAAHQDNTSRAWFHGSSDGYQGFLNSAGQWVLRITHTDGISPAIYFREEANETFPGNPGADIGLLVYHANRFYITSGSNSDRIVQFRRDGTDVSYIGNDGVFNGTATSARWADLAERYEADAIYQSGTILGIGGDKEVTLYQPGMPVAGAVSTLPAYRMNDMGYDTSNDSIEAKMNPFVALKGRIPVLINGSAKKGQWIIADKDGKGRAVDYGTPGINSFDIIGIAISNGTDEVEVKV